MPVVDLWTVAFTRALLDKFPALTFKRNEYSALLTVDSDQPFAYLGKSIFKSVGGLIRDLTVKSGHATERYKVVKHELTDPYEVFDYITEQARLNDSEIKFFFPTGDRSKYDVNPSWKNDEYRDLIRKIAEGHETGLHPSYYSAENKLLVNEEAERLKIITGKEITSARFHFIRLFMPASYRFISETQITRDYSMGYPEEPGFRAGIARPYPFYDIGKDCITNLTLVPFQIMDATLINYKNLDPHASKELIFKLIDETRRVRGLFVSLWHNTTVAETSLGKVWREVFELMLKYQKV